MTDEQLIFIVSQPRAGSTLLQALLSNNDQVVTTNETWLLFHFLNYYSPGLQNSNYSYILAQRATYDYLEKVNNGHLRFSKVIKNAVLDSYSFLLNNHTKYILDKTPRYYEILPEMTEIFPNAKFIILKRNPLAVLSSIIKTWNVKNLSKLYTYHRDILNAPFLLDNFIKDNQANRNVIEVKYETLVAKPLEVIQSIYNWLDIPFTRDNLEYFRNNKLPSGFGDSKFRSHRFANEQSLGDWKKHLKNSKWRSFFLGYANYLGSDIFRSYGYSESDLNISIKTKSLSFKLYKFICENDIPNRNRVNFDYVKYRILYFLFKH